MSFFKIFKFSLPHQKSSLVDVFNHSFWKLYIKIINELDPGLNLPERLSTLDKDLSVHLIYHDPRDLGSPILIRTISQKVQSIFCYAYA